MLRYSTAGEQGPQEAFDELEEAATTDEEESPLYNLRLETTRGSRIVSFLPESTSLRDLIKQISRTGSEVEKQGLRGGFVPRIQFERIISHDQIYQELEKIESSLFKRIKLWRDSRTKEDLERETHLINGTSPDSSIKGVKSLSRIRRSRCYRKIFAILLLIDRPDAIRKFIADAVHHQGICDHDLPLVRAPLTRSTKPFCLRARNNTGKEVSFSCLSLWTPFTLKNFEKAQVGLESSDFPFTGEISTQTSSSTARPGEY